MRERLEIEIEEMRSRQNGMRMEFNRERDELEMKHNYDTDRMEARLKVQEEQQRRTVLELKKTVEDLTDEVETLSLAAGPGNVLDDGAEEARQHLKCPICLELMRPPRRIWMCPQSHMVCEECRPRLDNNVCPTCRAARVNLRAFFAEIMASALFGHFVYV